eukprot:scaffold12381_cov24-Tisochrysis_lutea.AAC.3
MHLYSSWGCAQAAGVGTHAGAPKLTLGYACAAGAGVRAAATGDDAPLQPRVLGESLTCRKKYAHVGEWGVLPGGVPACAHTGGRHPYKGELELRRHERICVCAKLSRLSSSSRWSAGVLTCWCRWTRVGLAVCVIRKLRKYTFARAFVLWRWWSTHACPLTQSHCAVQRSV